MALENRVAENLGRKRLNVVGIEKDSQGNIVSLTVDVVRAEGQVSNQGTALTAEALNAEIEAKVNAAVTSLGQTTAQTQCTCDSSTKIATTEFVWDVLEAIGVTKITHNHNEIEDNDNTSDYQGT